MSRIDIQPSAAPSLVVSLTHLSADPALTVGSTIAASSTKVGRMLDLSGVEKQALSKFTQDAGNHVADRASRRRHTPTLSPEQDLLFAR